MTNVPTSRTQTSTKSSCQNSFISWSLEIYMGIHLQEFHLEVEIMPNKLPCVFHWCYVTSFRLVVGEECYLPGNIVHTKLRPDPPPSDPGSDHGDYAAIYQAFYTTHDLVREQHSLATLRQTWNYYAKGRPIWFTLNSTNKQKTLACKEKKTSIII